jgi:general stress protein 26
MNFIRSSFSFLVLIFGLTQFSLSTAAQQPPSFSREKLIEAAREIMTTTRYCALITAGSRGNTDARTMDAFAPDENMIVWFGTNPLSRKVAEIRRNPRVTLYYFDRESPAYVSFQGIARIVTDPEEKRLHWKEDWKGFYPDRERSYLLIAVRPVRIEVVNIKAGIVGTGRDWQPPTINFLSPKLRRK